MLATSEDEAEERILSSQASTVRVRVMETDGDARASMSVGRHICTLLSLSGSKIHFQTSALLFNPNPICLALDLRSPPLSRFLRNQSVLHTY